MPALKANLSLVSSGRKNSAHVPFFKKLPQTCINDKGNYKSAKFDKIISYFDFSSPGSKEAVKQ